MKHYLTEQSLLIKHLMVTFSVIVCLYVMQEGKALYMPTPGVRNHVISKVVQQKTSGNKRLLRSCMTRQVDASIIYCTGITQFVTYSNSS